MYRYWYLQKYFEAVENIKISFTFRLIFGKGGFTKVLGVAGLGYTNEEKEPKLRSVHAWVSLLKKVARESGEV